MLTCEYHLKVIRCALEQPTVPAAAAHLLRSTSEYWRWSDVDCLCLSGDGPSAADSSELVLEAASIACRADRISDSGSE